MRVVLLPVEIAAQASLQASALRKAGHDTKTLFDKHRFNYKTKPDYELQVSPLYWSAMQRIYFAFKLACKFDVYHYQFGQSLLPKSRLLDARLNRLFGSSVVVQFWGSDIRKPTLEAARNRFYVNSYNESDRKADYKMKLWADITEGHAIVQDHSFIEAASPHFQHLHIVRLAVDCQACVPVYPELETREPVLVHIPSQQAFKGTKFVRLAVAQLQKMGVKFVYREVSGVSHEEAMLLCSTADLVIDQLTYGVYGQFAVEAMSLGKPVICYIMQDMLDTFPTGLPVINANPENLVEVLTEWLTCNPVKRYEKGIASRNYAELVHDLPVIANQLLSAYSQLPGMYE